MASIGVLGAAASQTFALDADADARSSCATLSIPSSSPRQHPTDPSDPVLEDDETESESALEPVTPISNRASQDLLHPDTTNTSLGSEQTNATLMPAPPGVPKKVSLLFTTPLPQGAREQQQPSTPAPPSMTPEQDPGLAQPMRRRTQVPTSSFKRTMTGLFRRGNTHAAVLAVSEFGLLDRPQKPPSTHRFSLNRSSTTTRSNTPPSPCSLVDTTFKPRDMASPMVPYSHQFFDKQKQRAHTGSTLRSKAVNFFGNGAGSHANRNHAGHGQLRRANSFDARKKAPDSIIRSPWGLPADSGTGVKSRRMSLSLPDDVGVDVGELLEEYEYVNKVLGRHGKHLGKGATSKVTLMTRKGCPNELVAVKEFRGKSSSETKADYEKKVKSEYTVAMSLHHPNIIETMRLCLNHGRWNHVMEYCQEGDLLTLIQKKYLKDEDREKDRQCLFKQLLQGIHYLHSNGIAHRDIKCENLLITSDSRLKITDFGVSEVFCGIHPCLREAGGACGKRMGKVRLCSPGICGSPPYISPEVLEKKDAYDPRGLDVWGTAIVAICLIFGGNIWNEATPEWETYRSLAAGWEKLNASSETTDNDYPTVKAFQFGVNPPTWRRLLLKMLNPDPKKRLSVEEVLNNRWVRQIQCCQPESYKEAQMGIDAANIASLNRGTAQRKIFCHNHLPLTHQFGSHGLGKMPGQTGY